MVKRDRDAPNGPGPDRRSPPSPERREPPEPVEPDRREPPRREPPLRDPGQDPDGEPVEGPIEPVEVPIEPVLDLHSFQPQDVASVLEEYLLEARRSGFEEVRIVHGRGIGVQREIVRAVLARTPFVISFRD